MFAVCSLLQVCSGFGAKEKASNISNDNFGCGAFSGLLFGPDVKLRFYQGKLIYLKVTAKKKIQEPCGDATTAVTIDHFWNGFSGFQDLVESHVND